MSVKYLHCILVLEFCPLKPEIARFSIRFRLNLAFFFRNSWRLDSICEAKQKTITLQIVLGTFERIE